MNKKTKIALGIGIPVAMVVIFLLPLVVGEMNSSRVETKSEYNFYVCSGLNSRHEQRSAEYYQKVTEYDQKTAKYASALFGYNSESDPSPSYTIYLQQMHKELQQMYKELTNLETQVNTLANQYNIRCAT